MKVKDHTTKFCKHSAVHFVTENGPVEGWCLYCRMKATGSTAAEIKAAAEPFKEELCNCCKDRYVRVSARNGGMCSRCDRQ